MPVSPHGGEVSDVEQAEAGPSRGTTVTFLLRDEQGERFRVGEVVGPLEPDPVTGQMWVGVRVSDDSGKNAVSLIPLNTVLS